MLRSDGDDLHEEAFLTSSNAIDEERRNQLPAVRLSSTLSNDPLDSMDPFCRVI